MKFADIELDEDTHEVWKAGEPVSLSPTEFTLLRYFIINAGTVLSKPKILDHVWRYDFGGDVNVVESYVSYLRRKIDTGDKRLLHTLRVWGMYFANPGDNGGVPQIRRGIPLRVGLVAATLLLVGCGLLASGIAVTTIMHHTLINRVDDTLRDASRGWAQYPRQSPADPRIRAPIRAGLRRTTTCGSSSPAAPRGSRSTIATPSPTSPRTTTSGPTR